MASPIFGSMGQQYSHQQDPSRPSWTAFLTKMLADLMVDQVRRGNRVNNSFTKNAWKLICDDFYKNTGLRFDKEQLKNRYAVLRRQYAVVKFLLGRNDFILDESTGAVVATEEAWDEYVKDHPDAEAIRSGGCPIYKQLCEIFAEPAANGKHEPSNGPEIALPSLVADPVLHLTKVESLSEYDDVADSRGPVQPVTPTTAVSRKRQRIGMEDAIADAILEMATASKLQTAALKQLNKRFSIAECIRELDRLHGIAEHVYFTALEFFNKQSARETFLSLKSDKRLTWLQQKFNASRNGPN